MTDCRTVPPWNRRAAPEARLAMPEATAAICSARSTGSCSLAAMGSPSAETRMAWDTPGVSVVNLATSQSYSPLGWAMASVVYIGFLSVCSILCLGASGAHTVLVAVEVAADRFRITSRCCGGSRLLVGLVNGAGDQVAARASHGETGCRLFQGLGLLDPCGGRPGLVRLVG